MQCVNGAVAFYGHSPVVFRYSVATVRLWFVFSNQCDGEIKLLVFHCDMIKKCITLIVKEVITVSMQQAMPVIETRLGSELMAEIYKALNFEPAAFAKRHGDEFTHLYLRVDGMLSYVGEEIFSYLSPQVNECLSKAEYALLSYMEYAGRTQKIGDHDRFAQAVAHYLRERERTGSDWLYAFEGKDAKRRCLESYRQMYFIAQAMYAFAKETGEFKDVAKTDGPDAWPDPGKI